MVTSADWRRAFEPRPVALDQTRFVAVWALARHSSVCIVCGSESDRRVQVTVGARQDDYLMPPQLRLALFEALPPLTFGLPVCARHNVRPSFWPPRITVAIYDAVLPERVASAGRASEASAGGFTIRNGEGIGL